MKELYILCGAPGSGKTTFAKEKLIPKLDSVTYVSRDDIRYSFLTEADNYFDYEDKVYDTYIKNIQKGLEKSNNVICDATHLTELSRTFLLDKLDLSQVNVINIFCFTPPLNICLERNETRNGRAKVKRGVVRRMYFSMEVPSKEEKYGYLYRIHYIYD